MPLYERTSTVIEISDYYEGEPLPVYGYSRTCNICGTRLSIYNPGKTCWLHTPDELDKERQLKKTETRFRHPERGLACKWPHGCSGQTVSHWCEKHRQLIGQRRRAGWPRHLLLIPPQKGTGVRERAFAEAERGAFVDTEWWKLNQRLIERGVL